jgi:hypothetical protein
MLRPQRTGMLAAVAALAAAGGTAHANGRPPATVDVHVREGSTGDIYLATTFGLLISHDDGCSFRWVCEQAIGYGGTFDPKYRIARDGTIYATTFDGLRVSRDGGCTFSTALVHHNPSLSGVWVDAIDLGPEDDVWIGTAESGGSNDVYHSTDTGRTFTAMGLRTSTIWWKSIRVAPGDAGRIYVSGYQVASAPADLDALPPDQRPPGPAAFLMRSDDAGAHWAPAPLAQLLTATTPVVLIEAVDPQNADVVYARSVGANPPSGDRLYRSTDAGATWSEVFASVDAIRRVMFTADHRVMVATTGSGIHESADGVAFTPLGISIQTACLDQRGDGTFFACGTNWEPDFKALARSSDAAGWQKTFRFSELAGPVECPHTTAQYQQCELVAWPVLREQFGATPPACAAAEIDAATPPVGGGDGGCCGAGSGGGGGAAAAAFAGAALVAVIVRRRRPRSCCAPR